MQYLYDAGDDVVFMDEETYEQIHLPRESVEDALDVPAAVQLGADADGRRQARGRAAARRRSSWRSRRPSPASGATRSRT